MKEARHKGHVFNDSIYMETSRIVKYTETQRRRADCGCPGLGEREIGSDCLMGWVSFGVDNDVRKLDRGDGCTPPGRGPGSSDLPVWAAGSTNVLLQRGSAGGYVAPSPSSRIFNTAEALSNLLSTSVLRLGD